MLDGSKVSVPDADSAQLLIVDAVLDGAPARFLVPTDSAGVRIDRQQTLDITRSYCDVTLADVAVDAAALLARGAAASRSLERTMQLGAVLTCAELVGIGQRLLEMTVTYVKEREQFGRPVGSFQAVKHKCADMRIWVQASTAATYFAALALTASTTTPIVPPASPRHTCPTPSTGWRATRCSCTAASASPGNTIYICICGGPGSARCCAGMPAITASDSARRWKTNSPDRRLGERRSYTD